MRRAPGQVLPGHVIVEEAVDPPDAGAQCGGRREHEKVQLGLAQAQPEGQPTAWRNSKQFRQCGRNINLPPKGLKNGWKNPRQPCRTLNDRRQHGTSGHWRHSKGKCRLNDNARC